MASRVALSAITILIAACGPSEEETIAAQTAVVTRYCTDCHNNAEFTADLSLEGRALDDIAAHREVWERVVRKLRGGMMPPAGETRPEDDVYLGLINYLENELDEAYVPMLPAPGIHRLNRSEYANAVRDLLAVEVDAAQFLPADDSSRGFDNQAGTLSLSPALLEAYLSAAGKISRLAIGNVTTPTQTLYRVAEDTTQNYHVEGLPLGTRGGLLVTHQFPADGDYTLKIFSVNLGNMGNFRPFGEVRGEQLEILLDGQRVALVDWDQALVGRGFGGGQLRTIDIDVPVTAGPHDVGVTFLATNFAPGLDLNNDFERSTIETGGLPGFTFYPHVGRLRIDGPYNVTGTQTSPSRERLFVCMPSSTDGETACAERIVRTLARRAYRGFVEPEDIAALMELFALGREQGGSFDAGIEMVVQRVLVEPKFIYRIEKQPADLADGQVYALSDLELASRLSFFLWSSIPDDVLLDLAEQGRLSNPAVLAQQVGRMIDDPRSVAMTENFAGQWLALRNLESHAPLVDQFPDFDDNLRQAFRRESELFFDSIIRENRSVVDLLTADYTFVNERLAKHYGIPGVQGSLFRRVELGEDFDVRHGLLGKGSVLTVASQPGRTSPVMRGNWVLSTIIGIPAPDPPPDVPPLEAKVADAAGNTRQPTIREQYTMHRTNPACQGCHKLMDPFGFALEVFDATGRWRTTDNGNPIDPSDVMYDGTPVDGPVGVRRFLIKYQDQFVRNVTEKLMTYALGRGVEYYDMPVVRSIVRDVADDDYRFKALITAVVQSEPFRMNMKSSNTQTAAAPAERIRNEG